MDDEIRINNLILIACESGQSLDHLELLTLSYSNHDFNKWFGNVSDLPKYKKSKLVK